MFMSRFVRSQLKSLAEKLGNPHGHVTISGTKVEDELKYITSEAQMYHKVLMSDLSKLSESDGYASWRQKEAKELEELVQARIRAIQGWTKRWALGCVTLNKRPEGITQPRTQLLDRS